MSEQDDVDLQDRLREESRNRLLLRRRAGERWSEATGSEFERRWRL